MKVLDFYPANCKNCYKCVRNCPVKAIRIVDDQAEIIDEKCIACGKCFLVCPQNARNIHTDLNCFEEALKDKRVVVSVALSYKGIYEEPEKLIGALYGLGVEAVEETGVAAQLVSKLFSEYMSQQDQQNYITSCCPSVNLMIKTYYPELSEYLIPVDSPMVLHARLMKEHYGKDAFVVFLGPCISKKHEASVPSNQEAIDAVISFEELDHWLEEKHKSLDEFVARHPAAYADQMGSKYPRDGGILPGIKEVAKTRGKSVLAVHGFTECMTLFETIRSRGLQQLCIEANICHGACLGGPAIPEHAGSLFERKIRLHQELKKEKPSKKTYHETLLMHLEKPLYSREFSGESYQYPEFNEVQISQVLSKMAKHSKEDELNCGACGYDSCREKAKAVLEGISHLEMCIPNMRMKAERLSNVIFEVSPNILILLDENMSIVDMNPLGEKIFHVPISKMKGKSIEQIMAKDDFEEVINSKKDIIGKKIQLTQYNLKLIEYLIYIEEHKLVLGLFSNVTDFEKRNEDYYQLKQNTLHTVSAVIDRQMRVAQEIAGLLGETTAEAKIALLNLKEIVEGEEGEFK